MTVMQERPPGRAGAAQAVELRARITRPATDPQYSLAELVDMLTGGLPPLAETEDWRALCRNIRRAIERERQRLRWARFCQGRLRRPTLSLAERRRPVPAISDSPREALAAAWKAASAKDRRDLLAAAGSAGQ